MVNHIMGKKSLYYPVGFAFYNFCNLTYMLLILSDKMIDQWSNIGYK